MTALTLTFIPAGCGALCDQELAAYAPALESRRVVGACPGCPHSPRLQRSSRLRTGTSPSPSPPPRAWSAGSARTDPFDGRVPWSAVSVSKAILRVGRVRRTHMRTPRRGTLSRKWAG